MTFSAERHGETFLFLSAEDNGLTEGFALDNVGFGAITFEPADVSAVPVFNVLFFGTRAVGRRVVVGGL